MQEYKDLLKSQLSEERYTHCVNVANAAIKLAKHYDCDQNKAYTAGLLHDLTKELKEKEQLDIINKYGVKLDYVSYNSKKTWHSKTAAELIKHELNISDEDIINSISYHTTARANMSKLEKIVYIADLISDDRDYKDVEYVRSLAFESLDKCLLFCLEYTIKNLVERKSLIAVDTFDAYNYYLAKDKEIV